jgi:hypothetical protein
MNSNSSRKRIFLLAVATFLIMSAFISCATKTKFLSSAVVPAAEGSITIKKDANKNYVIKIKTINLADSQRLIPPRNVYVVWMVTDNNTTKNIGQIISSSGSMSNKLKASFVTVSSSKPTKIFITAENEANIQYTYSDVVLTTDVIALKK